MDRSIKRARKSDVKTPGQHYRVADDHVDLPSGRHLGIPLARDVVCSDLKVVQGAGDQGPGQDVPAVALEVEFLLVKVAVVRIAVGAALVRL